MPGVGEAHSRCDLRCQQGIPFPGKGYTKSTEPNLTIVAPSSTATA
jgi:hypothetical protein